MQDKDFGSLVVGDKCPFKHCQGRIRKNPSTDLLYCTRGHVSEDFELLKKHNLHRLNEEKTTPQPPTWGQNEAKKRFLERVRRLAGGNYHRYFRRCQLFLWFPWKGKKQMKDPTPLMWILLIACCVFFACYAPMVIKHHLEDLARRKKPLKPVCKD